MQWKAIVVGGVVMYAVMFVISMITGPLIHEGALDGLYRANESFWRPELNQDPPDMAALMPRWIAGGLITSLVFAAIYLRVRSALGGPGWKSGLHYGVILGVIMCAHAIGWSGIFDLPDALWFWWSAESFLYYLPGGAALGAVAKKLGG